MRVNGVKQLQRRRQRVDHATTRVEALARVHQKGISHFQLALEFLRPVTAQVIQHSGELRGDGINQSLRGILC